MSDDAPVCPKCGSSNNLYYMDPEYCMREVGPSAYYWCSSEDAVDTDYDSISFLGHVQCTSCDKYFDFESGKELRVDPSKLFNKAAEQILKQLAVERPADCLDYITITIPVFSQKDMKEEIDLEKENPELLP